MLLTIGYWVTGLRRFSPELFVIPILIVTYRYGLGDDNVSRKRLFLWTSPSGKKHLLFQKS